MIIVRVRLMFDQGGETMNDMTSMGGITDRQTFGAAVVTKTLDTMNNTGSGPAAFDKQTFGAAVVSKTLDYMNAGETGRHRAQSGMEQTYQFGKDVLSAAYTGKGTVIDSYT